ncbi:hypothetical protein [Haloferax sp. DFSO60]|uniref:hypothetical protein n=1 Tax=Haloferax sp. DFSO60 TaxID=3388652 RepID=UPI003977FFF6
MARERSTEQDPETTNDNLSVARRRYLSLFGSVAATGAITGLSGVATASESESNADSDEHTLVVAGTGTPSTFEVTVDGQITPLSSNGALSTVGALGPAAEGAVVKESRSYRFAGDITNFQSSDSVTVYVDGVRVPDNSF